MPEDTVSDSESVHVLLREYTQYVELELDATSTTSTVLVDVFVSEADAQRYLDQEVRKPLHRQYRIEEREVKKFD